MTDLISRQQVIELLEYEIELMRGSLDNVDFADHNARKGFEMAIEILEDDVSSIKDIREFPSAQPECKTGRLSNKEWIDFLVAQFDVSRTSARDMLHVMMQVKREDNFKKQFSQRNGCLVKDLVKEDGGGA